MIRADRPHGRCLGLWLVNLSKASNLSGVVGLPPQTPGRYVAILLPNIELFQQ